MKMILRPIIGQKVRFVKMYRKYPVCAKCSHTLDPNLEDGCGRYAILGGEIYCEYCLTDYLKDEVDERPFDVAEAIGLCVFETMNYGEVEE